MTRLQPSRVWTSQSPALTASVDLGRGAHLYQLVDGRTGIDLLYRDPRGPADHDIGGWYELFPNAGPGCVIDGTAIIQHGDVRDLPWTRMTEDGACLEATVRSAARPLALTRRVQVDHADTTVRITETLRNLSDQPQHYLWGHHITFGAPFVDAVVIDAGDALFYTTERYRPARSMLSVAEPAPLTGLTPRDHGAAGAADLTRFPDTPVAEMLFCDSAPAAGCRLRNRRLGLDVALTWDRTVFPAMWLWLHRGPYDPGGQDVTGLAIEPQASPVPSLADAIAADRAPLLAPQGRLTTWLQARIERSEPGDGY